MNLILLALLQAAAYVPAPAHAPIAPANPAYAKCAGSDQILAQGSNLSWKPGAPSLDRHREIRSKIGVSLPEGARRVLWYASGGDLGTTTFSVVATRDGAGLWHIDGVGQSQTWIQGSQPSELPRIDRTLSAEDSHRLDALIADPCLAVGPTFVDDPGIRAGGLYQNLEIEMPGRKWAGAWHGMPTRQEQAITSLMGVH